MPLFATHLRNCNWSVLDDKVELTSQADKQAFTKKGEDIQNKLLITTRITI